MTVESPLIFCKPILNSVGHGLRDLDDDRLANTVHHDKPNQAVCVHPIEHYNYWKSATA